ncbi:MAG: TetR/AcrR family transcriptional regulator, partial [Deltaproteobacteria bacterium]|nr:TetR/AcrR family transcriptional regulator [Deltaproteobacteria bacterium]
VPDMWLPARTYPGVVASGPKQLAVGAHPNGVTAAAPRSKEGPKAQRTRAVLLSTALYLFRERGFEATTMREIARMAGLSAGASYYHFSSKVGIIRAYYEQKTGEHVDRTDAIFRSTASLGERLRGAFHSKIELLARDRKLVGALLRSLSNPQDPLSIFAPENHPTRTGAVEIFERALAPLGLAAERARPLATALWGLHVAVLIYFSHDDSEDSARTHALIDDTVDLLAPLLELSGHVPAAQRTVDRLAELLAKAGLAA